MKDVFEQFGENITPQWKRDADMRTARRQAAAAAKRAAKPPMVKHGLELEQEEQGKQMVRYNAWKRQVLDGLTRGAYGNEIGALIKFMRKPNTPQAVLSCVLQAKWLLLCSLETRTTIFSYISHTLMVYNIRNGYPPFNDPLPWEPDDEFITIRKFLIT